MLTPEQETWLAAFAQQHLDAATGEQQRVADEESRRQKEADRLAFVAQQEAEVAAKIAAYDAAVAKDAPVKA